LITTSCILAILITYSNQPKAVAQLRQERNDEQLLPNFTDMIRIE